VTNGNEHVINWYCMRLRNEPVLRVRAIASTQPLHAMVEVT